MVVKGDLISLTLAGRFDVIIHGCNCQCVMGAGIAASIKDVFPEAYQADLATHKGDLRKLGTISSATVERNGHEITVVNAYTQPHWIGVGRKVRYEAIISCMEDVKKVFPGKRIGYPKIGAGLGGGDWEIISKIMDIELAGEDHTLVIL